MLMRHIALLILLFAATAAAQPVHRGPVAMANAVQKVTATMRRFALIFAFLACSRASFADDSHLGDSVEKAAHETDAPMAIAVNSPLGWIGGSSVAGSLYARVAPHQALRFNVASYEFGTPGAAVVGVLGEEDEGSYDGRLLDISAGWMYFPRRVWDGPTLEAGVLHRSGPTSVRDEFAEYEIVERDAQLFAGRALVGWSWHIADSALVSFAAGASMGYETGSEKDTKMTLGSTVPMTHDVSQWKAGFEGYLRFGFTFGK
jgi:hypothetical protein